MLTNLYLGHRLSTVSPLLCEIKKSRSKVLWIQHTIQLLKTYANSSLLALFSIIGVQEVVVMESFPKSLFFNNEDSEERRRAEREVTQRNRADQQDMTRNFDSHQQRTLRMLRDLSRPLNILVMGLPGCGKSTFITNVDFAVTNEYKEVASAGMFDCGRNVTLKLQKHFIKKQTHQIHHPLIIYDVPGLRNHQHDGLIRCLLEGRIPLGDNPNQDSASYENLLRAYPKVHAENIIDRVLFIHSAKGDIPEHLCNSTVDAARRKGKHKSSLNRSMRFARIVIGI